MNSYVEPSLTIMIGLVLLTLAFSQPIKVLRIGYVVIGSIYIIKAIYQINETRKLNRLVK